MILPDSEAEAWHARRRVTALPGLKGEKRLTTAAQTARKTGRNGIIPLTFTA
jgi:hypothetical protein